MAESSKAETFASDELVETLVAIEWEMFKAQGDVRPESGREVLLQHRDGFMASRTGQFKTWDEATAASYENDLRQALDQGRNLIVEKNLRALMLSGVDFGNALSDRFPQVAPEAESLARSIDETMETQLAACTLRYPAVCALIGGGDAGEEGVAEDFTSQMRLAEFMTYSPTTLHALRSWLDAWPIADKSFIHVMLENTAHACGFADLSDAETQLALG